MNDEDEVRDEIRRRVQEIPAPATRPAEQVARRARSLRVRRSLWIGLVVALAAGAVLVPLTSLRGLGEGTPAASAPGDDPSGGAQSSPPLPDVGLVICDENGTTVVTDPVRPQPDGVHFRSDNRTDMELAFDFNGTGGTTVPVGIHDVENGASFAFAPGTIEVRCRDPEAQDFEDEEGYVPMTIVDPEGLWSPNRVTGCDFPGTLIADYAEGAKGDQGDPVDLARSHFSAFLEPGDDVRPGGYPESPGATVVVVRGGEVVASAEFRSDGQGGWLLGTATTCQENPLPWDEAWVTCNERGTHVREGPVEPQADGVHVQVDNPLDHPVTLEVEGFGSVQAPPGGHDVAYPPTGSLGWPFSPGSTVRVHCEGLGVKDNGGSGGWLTFLIAG